MHWCRIFKLPPLDRKHHMIRVRNHAPNHFVFCFFRKRKRNSHCVILGKVVTVIDDCCNRCCFLFFFSLCVIGQYEPVFTAGSQPFVHHMNVYECVGDPSVFEVLAATEGSRCYQPSMPPLFFNCNNVVVAWTAGSEVCNKKNKSSCARGHQLPFLCLRLRVPIVGHLFH